MMHIEQHGLFLMKKLARGDGLDAPFGATGHTVWISMFLVSEDFGPRHLGEDSGVA